MYLLRLILRNLRRNLRRSALTAATVALATFIYTVLVSVPGSMDRIVSDATATLRLIVINKSLPFYGLPPRYCDEIMKMRGAAACVSVTGWPATYRDVSDPIFAVAEGLEIADVFPDYDLDGEARRAYHAERRGAFAGRVLMSKYHWKPGQLITLRGTGADHLELTFVLLGQMPSQRYPNVFAFRRDYLEEARRAVGYKSPTLAWDLTVRVDKVEDVAPLMKSINETFRNSDFEARALTESDALAGGLSLLGNLRAIVLSLCAVVVLTVMLIAANSSALAVRERLSEVAVMRTLGFGRWPIAVMLFGEVGAIGLCGGLLGAFSAFAFFASGATLGPLGGMVALWVTTPISAQAVVVAVAASLLSGLVPVINAIRIPPAQALARVV